LPPHGGKLPLNIVLVGAHGRPLKLYLNLSWHLLSERVQRMKTMTLKRFKTTYTTRSFPRPPAWTERLAAVLGGLAIVMLVLMALPFVLILFLVVQLRIFFSNPAAEQELHFPSWPWDVIAENEHIRVEWRQNHQLEQYADQDQHLSDDLEFGEFVAYGIRSNPPVPELADLYFDYCFLEWKNGLLLKGLSPIDEQDKDPIYFLDYEEKSLQVLGEVPANAEVSFVEEKDGNISARGTHGNEKFELKICIIEA
jgi:hypothetical protein